jgi:hypothetical protein
MGIQSPPPPTRSQGPGVVNGQSLPLRSSGYFTGRSIGRYQAQCSPTLCVADSGAGTSTIERDLFTLLRQVFDRGEQPYEVAGRTADMDLAWNPV